MSAIFYDKGDAETEKVAKDLCQRLDKIQDGYKTHTKCLQKAGNVYHDYDLEVQGRVAKLLTNERKLNKLEGLVWTSVGIVGLWEIFHQGRVLLKWIGKKLAQEDEKEFTRRRSRIHVRDWNHD
jgi:hypothetical protein